MRFKSNKKLISTLLCMMLIVAMAFTTVACKTNNNGADSQAVAETQSVAETQPAAEAQTTAESGNTVLGEGQTKFAFAVVDKDGNETNFEIHTDKILVGEALLDLGLIEGDAGEFGLYVKTVNGITADYDVDQTYWAFYVNDAYATSGVDVTPIEAGAKYAFKVEK